VVCNGANVTQLYVKTISSILHSLFALVFWRPTIVFFILPVHWQWVWFNCHFFSPKRQSCSMKLLLQTECLWVVFLNFGCFTWSLRLHYKCLKEVNRNKYLLGAAFILEFICLWLQCGVGVFNGLVAQ
jgi:hypothetical protein